MSPSISQSHLLCFKTLSTCFPHAETATWHLYDCNGYDGTGLMGSKKNENQVTFGHGDILNLPFGILPTIGSSQVVDAPLLGKPTSGCEFGMDPGMKAYNATTWLNPQLNNQTSIGGPKGKVHVDQFVPPGQGTTYVVSCYSIEYDIIPPSPAVRRYAESHDYFLVLDMLDDPMNWVMALLYHEDAPKGDPTTKHPPGTISMAEQGLYDLSGNNGCPSDMNQVIPDLVDKAKDAPLVTVPPDIVP